VRAAGSARAFLTASEHSIQKALASRDERLWYNVERRCSEIEERFSSVAVLSQRSVVSRVHAHQVL
jgi:hypothetical protein